MPPALVADTRPLGHLDDVEQITWGREGGGGGRGGGGRCGCIDSYGGM